MGTIINKTFHDTFGKLYTQEYKTTKKQIVRLQLNEVKGKPDKNNELIMKTKANLKEGLRNI